MIEGLIGRKIGMTEVFKEDGRAVPVTAIKVGPCFVVQKKTKDVDGYSALQLGFEDIKPQRVRKPLMGHFRKSGVPPLKVLKEFRVVEVVEDDLSSYKTGDVITGEIFKEGDLVDVTGTSKGRGFAGVMKRHGFSGGPDAHGSMTHRKPGSVGSHTYPAKVWKGQRMPGHYGAERVTMQGLSVVRVDKEKNLILVKGSVPGPSGGLVVVRHTKKGRIREG